MSNIQGLPRGIDSFTLSLVDIIRFKINSIIFQYKGNDKVDKNAEDVENFSEYGKAVGKIVSRHTYLVI